MPIFDIFSKRQARRSPPSVVVFDDLPANLRHQLLRVFLRTIGERTHPIWDSIANALRDEWGVPQLHRRAEGGVAEVLTALEAEKDVSRVIDIAELCLRVIDTQCRREDFGYRVYKYHNSGVPEQTPDSAIDECNTRMREAGVGYRYIKGEGVIVRADSEFGHQENVVAPLALLVEVEFQGAEEEFLKAHSKYRHSDFSGAMAEAVKSLESTLKTICDKKSWTDLLGRTKVPQRRPLSKSSSTTSSRRRASSRPAPGILRRLVKTLEDGAGPLRNQAGGAHGAGLVPVTLKDYEAAYCLGITGAAIRLLVDAYKDSLR